MSLHVVDFDQTNASRIPSAAHDRAVRLFPPKDAIIGQLPMMVLMIGYTIGGLSLLFSG